MDQQFDFRAFLLKLQDCLSDNDRRRLHFIVGDTIPRYLRDDPTLAGTLNLLESLFDQAKISEQDFDYLIQAFREIHCHEGVKRLEEYQFTKHGRIQGNTTSSMAMNDSEVDKLNVTRGFWMCSTIDNSRERVTVENQGISRSINEQNNDNVEKSSRPITCIKSDKKIVNVNLTFIKQTLKSRLTACQLILFLLNIVALLTFIIIIIILRKQSCVQKAKHCENVLIIREGLLYGEPFGGEYFDDSFLNSFTSNDKLIAVNATWSFDTLISVTFIYSNGGISRHGSGDASRTSLYSGEFTLNSAENFIGVTIYRSLRDIINPYKPNGTSIVVGLRFSTSKARKSNLFGSSNGTEYNEMFSGYKLAYIRGRSYGFVDALQFMWYKTYKYNRTIIISAI